MKKVWFIISFVLMTIVLIACGKKLEVTTIALDGDTELVEVELGDFALSDYELIITYSDNSTKKVVLEKSMISDSDFAKISTAGTHTITINYLEKSLVFSFTIYENVTITFNANGGVLVGSSTVELRKGTKLANLPTITKNDLVFVGWKLADGSLFTTNTVVDSNITLTADFNDIDSITMDNKTIKAEVLKEELNLSDIKIIVTYEDGNTKKVSVTNDMLSAADLAKLSSAGTHTITVNYLGESLSFSFLIYENVTITFNANGGTLVGSSTIAIRKGSKLSTLPTVTKPDLTFVGWKLADGTSITTDSLITMDITVIADFNDVKSIAVDSASIPTDTLAGSLTLGNIKINVTYEDNTSKTTSLTQSMLSAADFAKLSTAGTHSLTVTYLGKTALFNITIIEKVKITFNANGGVLVGNSSIEIKKGTKLTNLPTITKDDLTFLGWKLADGTLFTIDTVVNNDITITADFNEIESISVDALTIPEEAVLGAISLSDIKVTVKFEDGKTKRINLTQEMLSTADFAKLSTTGTHVLTVNYKEKTASLTITIYESIVITFNNEGVISTINIKKGSKILKLPIPKKDDYEFIGWKKADGTLIDENTIFNENIELTASWDEIPNSQKVSFTYYFIEDIEVAKVSYGFVFSKNGGLFIPIYNNEIFNKKSNSMEMLYYDFYDFLDSSPFSDGELVVDVLFYDTYDGDQLVLKTNLNNYYGLFKDNSSGQYGLGHNDEINFRFTKLFTNIVLQENEEIITTYVHFGYNVAITNLNRVFFTGEVYQDYDNDSIYDYHFETNLPVEITDEFDLDADEYFLTASQINKDYGPFTCKTIYTNKRVFGLSSLFTEASNSDNIFIDLTEVFNEKTLYAYADAENVMYFVITQTGKLIHSNNDVVIQIDLDENEVITSVTMHGLYYDVFIIKTSENRVLLYTFGDPDMMVISDLFTTFEIANAYLYSYYLVMVDINGNVYYSDGKMDNEGKYIVYNLSEDFSDSQIDIAFNDAHESMMFIVINGEYYILNNKNIEKYTIPVMTTKTEYHKIGNEITLPDYQNENYYIKGWANNNDELYSNVVVAQENIIIVQKMYQVHEITLIMDLGEFNDYVGQIYIVDGDYLTEAKFKEALLNYFTFNEYDYGNLDMYLLKYANDRNYDFSMPIERDQTLFISLNKDYLVPVFVTYYDDQGEIVGYDNLFVGIGGTLNDFYIEFNHNIKYNIDKFYTDYQKQIEFGLDTIINDSMLLDITLVTKEKYTITIILPDELGNLEYDVYENQRFPFKIFDDLFRISYDKGYTYSDLFLDSNYTKEFFDFEFSGDSNITLYAKLEKENVSDYINVYIKYYIGDKALTHYNRMLQLPQDANLNYHIFTPSGYSIDGIYLDFEKTQEVTALNDINITELYVFLDYYLGEFIEVDLIFPQLDLEYHLAEYMETYQFGNFLGNYIDAYTGIYITPFKMYMDINKEYEIFSYNYIEQYDQIYIYIDEEELYEITINFDIPEVTQLVFYLPSNMLLFNESIFNRLELINNKYKIDSLVLFNDIDKTNEFFMYNPDNYYDGLILYAKVDYSQLYTFTINFPDKTVIQLYNTAKSEEELINYLSQNIRVLELDYDIDNYEIQLYIDELYETIFNNYPVNSDKELFVKFVEKQKANIKLIFNENYQNLQFTFPLDSQLVSNDLIEKIYMQYGIEERDYAIFLNDSYTEKLPYSQLIEGDTTFYIKLNKKVKIISPYTNTPELSLILSDDEVIDVLTIDEILSDYDNKYQYSNIKIYLDSKMTIEYIGQELDSGDYLFVTFDKDLVINIDVIISIYQYNELYPNNAYKEDFDLKGNFTVEDFKSRVNDFLKAFYEAGEYEILGVYFDPFFTIPVTGTINEKTTLHVKVLEKFVEIDFEVEGYDGLKFTTSQVLGMPIDNEEIQFNLFNLDIEFETFEIYVDDILYNLEILDESSLSSKFKIKIIE